MDSRGPPTPKSRHRILRKDIPSVEVGRRRQLNIVAIAARGVGVPRLRNLYSRWIGKVRTNGWRRDTDSRSYWRAKGWYQDGCHGKREMRELTHDDLAIDSLKGNKGQRDTS